MNAENKTWRRKQKSKNKLTFFLTVKIREFLDKFQNAKNKGVALYITIVILSALSASILAMIGLSIAQIKISWMAGDSAVAFYASDTGVEKALYAIYKGGYVPVLGECPSNLTAVLDNGSNYEVCVSDTSTSTILSTGTFRDTKRAIRIEY